MITAMSWLLIVWAGLALYFTVVGSGVRRLLGLGDGDRLAPAFWTGWGVVIALLQILHLFFPCESPVVFLVLALSLAIGLSWDARGVGRALAASWQNDRVLWILAGLVAFWLSNRALGPLLTIDAGLYHLPSVKWAREFSIVPGLGNLHGRLAFNSAHFLYLATLDGIVPGLRSFNIGTWPLLLAAALTLLQSSRRLRSDDPILRFRAWFSVVLLLPLAHAGIVMHLSSTSPDWALVCVGVVLAHELVRIWQPEPDDDLPASLFTIALLGAVGIALKLSFAAVGGSAIVAAGWALWRSRAGSDGLGSVRSFVPAGLVCLAILVPWSLRSVALSGYPAYPSAFAPQDVAWTIPEERVLAETRWIRSWSRMPGESPERVLGSADWIGPWLSSRLKNADSVALLVLPGLLLLVTSLGSLSRRDWKPGERPARLGLSAPFAIGIVFWFATAPDPRFLGPVLWILAALSAAWLLSPETSDTTSRPARRRVRSVAIVAAGLVCAASLGFTGFMCWKLGGPIIQPGPDAARPRLRAAPTREFRTGSGLVLRVPIVGDGCWDAPLPCTPYPAPRLTLRREGELGSGFVLR